ncbi:MAG TPA: anti-sigma factor [Pyrinomonadaceae bacterium]|nr:anti-sigma factor [Pyrinomonadaceae bacterium]
MNCSNVKFELSPYLDGLSGAEESAAVESHLEHCPLCRQTADDLRSLRSGLRGLEHPVIPERVVGSIRETVANRVALGAPNREMPFIPEWLSDPRRVWLMSYSVGSVASLVLGFSFLWMILMPASTSRQPSLAINSGSSGSGIMLAGNAPTREPSPAAYAQTRRDVSSESPSINPDGALIELTKLLVQGQMKDDEVVVVADVYSNGSAQIAQVVEPSHNRDAVVELARALDNSPASTPFVPAAFDKRSDSVRVIFKIQTVYVSTQEKPRKRTSL